MSDPRLSIAELQALSDLTHRLISACHDSWCDRCEALRESLREALSEALTRAMTEGVRLEEGE